MRLEDEVGRIVSIQRFSLHDGPGIRTVVFLKGCALRCPWCCNPETQETGVQIAIDGKTFGKDVTAGEVMEEVERDEPYYRRSGGGITLSGGECLLQPQFSSALLSLAKSKGFSTAIESTAYGSYETIKNFILDPLDIFLLDIKHADPEKHKQITGKSNAPMIENARQIAASGQKLIARVPIIPNFNDTCADIRDIARLAKSLPGVEKIHLLPYHMYGAGKYAALGRKYLMGDAKPPTDALMQALKEEAEAQGLDAQIGG
ncbi:MAG: glycyl-radical enzyme activating protein [Clostridiales bacterium]|jgi:pyruvate formate lyase activating enzyme|nr:glycyl-radical enzyme activating protein [Clostridiales bacterium]